jgi:hypothetical protein
VKAVTTLKVTLSDQTLIAAEKVRIASGDIDSVRLTVEFDEMWTRFDSKTASFYTSHDSTPIERLLSNNRCVVPPEVLEKPGILYIGIIGVTADGESVKTSSIVSFKITQGASHAYTTLKPTMSLYQQFLAAAKAEVDPVSKAFKAEIMADYEAVKNDLIPLLNGEVVWTNPDSSVEFEAQPIPIDLRDYKKIKVVFRHQASDNFGGGYSESDASVKGLSYHHYCGSFSGSDITFARAFSFGDDGVDFGDAKMSGDTKNSYIVPVEIRAYKHY